MLLHDETMRIAASPAATETVAPAGREAAVSYCSARNAASACAIDGAPGTS